MATAPPSNTAVKDPRLAARAAHLRYVSDTSPGISRKRAGTRFRYRSADGKPVRDPETLERIRSLAIPPAWTQVWICALPNGHIQATGRDARGRKQYRYHERWRQIRDETKYHRLLAFSKALPGLRGRVEADLRLPGLPCEKVLATVVRLLELTLIRVGNEEYARENHSFGLTTLRDRHVAVNGAEVTFRFKGKSGVKHSISVTDRRLAKIVKRCQELPGHELFQYLDEAGEERQVTSADVNEYLRQATGEEFTAKDFRTWAGSVMAAEALVDLGVVSEPREAKSNVVRAITTVAAKLGNTVAVCRKCYVHPRVLETYLDGTLIECWSARIGGRSRGSSQSLAESERRLVRLLKRLGGTGE